MSSYIWQHPDWPQFTYDASSLLTCIDEVSHAQGTVETLLAQLGISEIRELEARIFTDEIYHSHEIEGEVLEQLKIYSSLCRRLQVPNASMHLSGPHIEGVVETLLDALKSSLPLTHQRIFSWHRTLFPQNLSGPFIIHAGAYRTESIAVVSGSFKNEEVLFEAPPAEVVHQHMETFLTWINAPSAIPDSIRSSIAHLWFLTIHPFEDGNGRLARTIGDYVLNQHHDSNQVLFSLSTQLKKHQSEYYEQLRQAQQGNLDCTNWIRWYLGQIREAQERVVETCKRTLQVKHMFERLSFNERQCSMLERLTTDFYGSLTTQKWAKLTHCSHDTAMRDIKDLINKGVLKQSESGGRSTRYELMFQEKNFPHGFLGQ
ncbi:Fic family protein [Sphaerochaeta globosa]|uniref:Filamentation induced by cAMP protein Fic n=1 Tax=Sphaerochaeta globosa (strain ATCC BAA-1886 / DSM 22777 / Buddy) TaxID=158189 RepID=F0RUK1_SPHGB|nr:Fic family protein [Sphaerochaeta globosa]ADY12363.1 filamentation induced by cAMP protein Fic [Sphaerochaeta globosa str. Buddy]